MGNPPPQQKRRFSIRMMLVVVAICAGLIWLTTEYGKIECRFTIVGSDLTATAERRYSGTVRWQYCRAADVRSAAGQQQKRETVLLVDHIHSNRISHLNDGDVFEVRYRPADNLLFEKENPFILFLTRKLGIPQDEIVGFVELEGESQVIARGK